MNKFSYSNSQKFFNPIFQVKNKNNGSMKGSQNSINIKKFNKKANFSPKSLNTSKEARYRFYNNSPLSSKTENISKYNGKKLNLFPNDNINNRMKQLNEYVSIDKMNNSLYTSNSRMNKSLKNFYPSSKFNYLNRNNELNDSFGRTLNNNNQNYKNITIKNVFNSPSINKNNHYIQMINRNEYLNSKTTDNFNKLKNRNRNNLKNNNNSQQIKQTYEQIWNDLIKKNNIIGQLKNNINYLNQKLIEKEEQLNSLKKDDNEYDNDTDNNNEIFFPNNNFDNLDLNKISPLIKMKNQELKILRIQYKIL